MTGTFSQTVGNTLIIKCQGLNADTGTLGEVRFSEINKFSFHVNM